MATTLPDQPAPSSAQIREDRRRALATTPGRLRVQSIVLLVAAVLTGLVASFVVGNHSSSTRDIAREAEPVIVSSRKIQTNLAEANAAAANAFLAGGVENPVQRAVYGEALDEAAKELERATRLVGDDPEAHARLEEMTAALPRYAGMIETARANNRQGFPVGSTYLNGATTLLEDEIYPGTDDVANLAAAQYRDSYNGLRGFGLITAIVAVVLMLIVTLVLIYLQFQLRRRFNRLLNVPILLATLLAVGLTGWMTIAFTSEIDRLTSARTDGYEGTRLYLDIRGIGFGAKADEARFLIARGAGEAFQADVEQRARLIDEMEPSFGNHAQDSFDRGRAEEFVDQTYIAWRNYLATHDELVEADRSGAREEAVTLALTVANDDFAEFDRVTAEALAANQERFDDRMAAAERSMSFLRIGILLGLAVIVALALYGLQIRINEYR